VKLKSNTSMATARQTASFKKGEYRGLDVSKLVIRPGGLDVLRKPSLQGKTLVPYRSVFDKESGNGK
jgi:hypothetical protein